MRSKMLPHRVLVTACCLALLVASSLGRGEVRSGEPEPRPVPERPALTPASDLALRARCWQHGVEVIDQDGLPSLSLNALIKEQAVAFGGQAEGQPAVFILPLGDGLCLVQPDTRAAGAARISKAPSIRTGCTGTARFRSACDCRA